MTALAWPGFCESQSTLKPGQSHGFQAKPGQHNTSWWSSGFFAIAIDLLLSPLISVASFSGNPNCSCSCFSQQASCAALDSAIYLASIDESAVIVCFFDLQVMAPP